MLEAVLEVVRGFNTQPPEGGWVTINGKAIVPTVSTHSRLKAAGQTRSPAKAVCPCFNTQPPEGGWPPHLSCFGC